mgnify:CR=1 FL=1
MLHVALGVDLEEDVVIAVQIAVAHEGLEHVLVDERHDQLGREAQGAAACGR